jgi:hypothetical protein
LINNFAIAGVSLNDCDVENLHGRKGGEKGK